MFSLYLDSKSCTFIGYFYNIDSCYIDIYVDASVLFICVPMVTHINNTKNSLKLMYEPISKVKGHISEVKGHVLYITRLTFKYIMGSKVKWVKLLSHASMIDIVFYTSNNSINWKTKMQNRQRSYYYSVSIISAKIAYWWVSSECQLLPVQKYCFQIYGFRMFFEKFQFHYIELSM